MELDNEMLAAGLGATAIVQRGGSGSSSASGGEIVSCRMPDDNVVKLSCKFGPLAEAPQPTDRFGVAYEAQVYDQLLCSWRDDVPRLHGAFLDESTQTICLAVEYLDDATPLYQVPEPKSGLGAAARWIARFHRWSETATVPPFLHRYNTDFYRVWIQRAGQVSDRWRQRHPWLPDLCRQCQRRLPALLPPATMIHGRYEANNVLVHNGRNVVVDWESAALAAGEIDLATLTWGWDHELVQFCEQQYCLARWPDGPPADFALRLTAARVYFHLRRLGDSDDEDGKTCDLDQLLPLAKSLQ
jgi:hypothetical protein